MKASEPSMGNNTQKPPQDQIKALAELYHQMNFSEVLEKGAQVAAQHPNDITILNILGAANAALKQWGHAADCYRKAVQIAPDDDGYYNLGVILYNLGERSEAMESFLHALKINAAHPEANSNLGLVLCDLGRNDEAIKHFNRAIQVNPNYFDAHNNLGLAHSATGQYDKAVQSFQTTLNINPDLASARAEKMHLQALICDWDAIGEDAEFIPQLGLKGGPVSPFTMLAFDDDPARNCERSRRYVETKSSGATLPRIAPLSIKSSRLKIGYFSADFYNHPMMNLMGKIFEMHDRTKFCVHAFSIGPPKIDETRKQLTGKFDKFHDVFDETDRQIAELARSEGIDIAIDLNGYTENHRSGIFAYRAAPIQINYLGYPGTMGADFMDYIIADRIVIPEKTTEHYSESVIYLPHTYQVNDNSKKIADVKFSRTKEGLPEAGLVICCFNNSYKIGGDEFDIWMRLLKQIDGSVLWLLKSNQWAETNLKMETRNRGVSSDRLVFAERLPLSEHLARHRLADIFLDTFNYNAHTTASDALWAGLPIVTKLGNGFPSRVAGSLLNAINIPELITQSREEYEHLALELGTNPEKLQGVKEKLLINREHSPLFNTELFTIKMEDAFRQAHERYIDGLEPEMIFVQ